MVSARTVRITTVLTAIGLMLSGCTLPVEPRAVTAADVSRPPPTTTTTSVETGPSPSDLREREVPRRERIRSCVIDAVGLTDVPGTMTGAVVDGISGERLWAAGEEEKVPTASVVKLFTAVAALNVLGPEYRFETRVVEGSQSGEIFLVGGGDVTLTRSAERNYYNSAASLDLLARLSLNTLGLPPGSQVTVKSDGSRYQDFPPWSNSWRQGSAGLGFIAPVSAVQVDGDRDIPWQRLSPRSMNPELRALEWFGESLLSENPSLVVVTGGPGRAPEDGRVLATVSSAPIVDLIDIMVADSDNSLAEVIGREVALALDLVDIGEAVSTGAGVTPALLDQVDLQGASGLSSETVASHQAVTELLLEIDSDSEFASIRASLPVGAETGSLRNRFASVSPELAGRVEAKTGSIRGTRSLAGYVRADDGAELVFSFNVTGDQVDNSSRDDIDVLLAEVSRCGANLAHWEPQDRE